MPASSMSVYQGKLFLQAVAINAATLGLLCISAVTTLAAPATTQPANSGDAGGATQSTEELALLKQQALDEPQDAKIHYKYAHALRLSGQHQRAATEYLRATELDPAMYVAYHELALSKARPDEIDEALERLNGLKEERPRDLMLRVALSELYEQEGKLYPASKVLVELVFENAVPPNYLPRVKARIHYLLSRNKDAQSGEKAQEAEPETESAPLPLPESTFKHRLSGAQWKDSKAMQSFGNTTLLP